MEGKKRCLYNIVGKFLVYTFRESINKPKNKWEEVVSLVREELLRQMDCDTLLIYLLLSPLMGLAAPDRPQTGPQCRGS